MFNLKETSKDVTVVFDKKDDLRDAPEVTFKKNRFGSIKKARAAAAKYGNGLVRLYSQSKFMAAVIADIPVLNEDKVRFHVDDIRNKTGVVGVHLEYTYDRLSRKQKYSYTACYNIDGKQIKKRFPLNKFASEEQAYRAAVSHRILALNLSRDLLQKRV